MKTRILFILSVMLALASCEDDNGPMNWVDLRYDVPQESYLIDAAGTESVTIRVKSTDPWTVFGGKGESWYTITPDSGDPGEIYTVTITCEENTSLDDRCDTIYVKSDYWTGTQFLLTQKGTAYLDFELSQDIEQSGEEVTLEILTNQDWKAEVAVGGEWITVSGATSGNGNGSIMLGAPFNGGEQRSGEVVLYDRNDVAVQVVTVTQKGVILSPAAAENGKFFQLYSRQQELRIPVESNSEWIVAKAQGDDQGWYNFDGGTSYNGTQELVINVSEYPEGGASAVRTGTITLTSKAVEGFEPVTKTIRFKQASPDRNRTQSNDGKVLDSDGVRSEDGIPAGRYTFYLAPFTATDCIYLYFFWQRDGKSFAELRFWLNTEFAPLKTELSCMPYCNDVNKWQNNLLVAIDMTKPVKIAMDISESAPDPSGNTWIYSEWWLNDTRIAHATSDGIVDRDGGTDTWKTKYADTIGTGYFRIWAFTGSATLEKWEYTSPIVWGE